MLPGECAGMVFRHSHTTVLTDLPLSSRYLALAVLREPVSRFISLWEMFVYGQMCAEYSKQSFWANGPLSSAQALVADKKLKEIFLQREQSNGEEYWKNCPEIRAAWPQALYVAENSQNVLCLPTAFRDLNDLLRRNGVACKIKKPPIINGAEDRCSRTKCEKSRASRRRKMSDPARGRMLTKSYCPYDKDCNPVNASRVSVDELRPLVYELYSEDFRLWKHHCGSRGE